MKSRRRHFPRGELDDRFFLFESKGVMKSSAGRAIQCAVARDSYPLPGDARTAVSQYRLLFYQTLLREYCEKDLSRSEILKRFSLLMYQRGQAIGIKAVTPLPPERQGVEGSMKIGWLLPYSAKARLQRLTPSCSCAEGRAACHTADCKAVTQHRLHIRYAPANICEAKGNPCVRNAAKTGETLRH